jgi:Tfp pilus assembly protein PilZ
MVHYRNKRADPRNPCKLPATVEEVKDNFLYRARLVNYSNNGVFLETDVILESGTEIVVGIENSPFEAPSSPATSDASGGPECYRARVIWQKDIQGSIFNYGYGAHLIFEDDQIPPQAGEFRGKPELREHPRKSYAKVALFTCGAQFYKGLIKNVGRRGVFIETKGEFNVGQIIKLVIPGTRIDNGVMLKGEIVRCDPTGIGVKFKSLLKKKNAAGDQNGRRSGSERRRRFLAGYSPEQRTGADRRTTSDRRKNKHI